MKPSLQMTSLILLVSSLLTFGRPISAAPSDRDFSDEKSVLIHLLNNYRAIPRPIALSLSEIATLQKYESQSPSRTELARLYSIEAGYNGVVAKIYHSPLSITSLKLSSELYEKSLDLAPHDANVVTAYAKFARGICDTNFGERLFLSVCRVSFDTAAVSKVALEHIEQVTNFDSDQMKDLEDLRSQLQRCAASNPN